MLSEICVKPAGHVILLEAGDLFAFLACQSVSRIMKLYGRNMKQPDKPNSGFQVLLLNWRNCMP